MIKPLNVLLVEDNYDDLKFASKLMKENFPDVNLFVAGNGHDAILKLASYDMDLLLLDIKLPDCTGFDVAREIRDIPQYRFVHIIYITGEDYDPLETYDKYHCYAFISKPYTENSLVKQLAPLISGLKKERMEGRIPVRQEARAFTTTKGELVMPINDILYAELRLRNIIIHSRKGEYQTKRMSLRAFEEYINDPDFFICHESFIVNIRKVRMIERTGQRSYIAVFSNSDDRGCIVSQKRYNAMKELLDKKAEKTKAGN